MDSDFAPFLHHAGIPSVDLHYGIGTSLILLYFQIIDGC